VTAASRLSLLSLLVCARAFAQAPSDADVAFKKGREFLKAGKYAEACVEFEKSESLDPQLGTRFNIAQCDEKQGKLAAALELFRELAAKDTNAQRKQISADSLASLEKRVPRVQIQVAPQPAGLSVKLGDRAVSCTAGKCEARVDRGHYEAAASAPSFNTATASVDVDTEGATVIVKLALTPAATTTTPTAPVAITTPTEAPPPSRSHRKTYAVVALAAGGATLITGAIFGSLASGEWSDAKSACGGSTTCPDSASLAKANSLRDKASSKATISTGMFIAGGLLASAGLVLYLTAPSDHELTVAPTGTGVSLSGRF
jgi:hypothetical protein